MKLFFRHFGKGEPIIILHGLFGISDNWVTIGKKLAAHFEVFIPDLRNHGQSAHSQVFTISAMVEDLVELTEDLGFEDIILAGHSLGGLIAMQSALQYPNIVKKLVVVDISLRRHHNYEDHIRLINAMMDVDFSEVAKRSDVERQLLGAIGSSRLRKFLLKNIYWRDKKTLNWRLNLPVLNDSLPLIQGDLAGAAKFEGPALFVRGGLSDYIREEDLAEIYEKFPRAVFSTIPNASHWVHADAPEEFYKTVTGFLL